MVPLQIQRGNPILAGPRGPGPHHCRSGINERSIQVKDDSLEDLDRPTDPNPRLLLLQLTSTPFG